MQTDVAGVRRKSARLSDTEFELLQQYIGEFLSLREAADAIRVPRQRLERFLIIKRSSPDTIALVRAALEQRGLVAA